MGAVLMKTFVYQLGVAVVAMVDGNGDGRPVLCSGQFLLGICTSVLGEYKSRLAIWAPRARGEIRSTSCIIYFHFERPMNVSLLSRDRCCGFCTVGRLIRRRAQSVPSRVTITAYGTRYCRCGRLQPAPGTRWPPVPGTGPYNTYLLT